MLDAQVNVPKRNQRLQSHFIVRFRLLTLDVNAPSFSFALLSLFLNLLLFRLDPPEEVGVPNGYRIMAFLKLAMSTILAYIYSVHNTLVDVVAQ